MTPEQAAWVRAQVWPAPMRKTYSECPGFYERCACQGGPTAWCTEGKHERCSSSEPLRSYETLICGRGGTRPVYFTEDFVHASDVSATGPRRSRDAMVWLADRVCRWQCPCDCGHTGAKSPAAGGDDGTDRPIEQLDLFDLIA